ncbi:MAG TPA: polysaccharide biosynthesis tyrosine autokinase [Longimicrobiaceae bacterium]
MANELPAPNSLVPGRFPGSDASSDPRNDVVTFLGMLLSHWKLILLGGLLSLGVTYYRLSQQLPQYTSEVLLMKTEASPLTASGLGTDRRSVDDDFASQVEIIRSRVVMAAVVDSLGLALQFIDHPRYQSRILDQVQVDRDPDTGRYQIGFARGRLALLDGQGEVLDTASDDGWLEGPGFRFHVAEPEAARADPIWFMVRSPDRAAETLRRRIEAGPGKSMDIIRVSYTDPDPERSARVVNVVAQVYRDLRARSAREAARARRMFLADQVAALSDSLRVAQNDILAFQQQERVLHPESEGSALTTALFQAESERQRLRLDERLMETLVEGARDGAQNVSELQRLVAMGREVLPDGDGMYSRLQQLETERSRLTASQFGYTERSSQVQVVDSLIAATRTQVRIAAEQSLLLLRERVAAVEVRIADLRRRLSEAPQRSTDFARMQQRVDAVQSALLPLVGRYYEARVAEAVQLGDVELVDQAPTPLNPDPEHRGLKLAIALFAGVLLSSGGVGLRYYFSTTVRRREDVESATGLPVFGFIPHLDISPKNGAARFAGVEAFRALAANLRLATPVHPKVIAVTSAMPKDGKSTVAANLALTMVQQGSRTLLIEADLRRPTVHKTFAISQSPGLTDVLLGNVGLDVAIRRIEAYELDVITAGSDFDNPPSLLGSTAFSELMDHVRAEYDVVIIDTNPILAVADASLLCSQVTGVVLTVRANRTDRMAVVQCMEQIRRARGTIIGVVLSDIPSGPAGYSYYRLGTYGYEHTREAEDGERTAHERRRPLIGSWSRPVN